ncbi:MAG: PQQ-binding-like beta-propeller repeat protein [Planctomycetaceae bacterium]
MQSRNLWLCRWVVLCSCVCSSVGQAENWPGWRGPRGDGSSEESQVPVTWSESEHIAWKVKLPCGGHSSPIVFGNRVFLVGANTGEQPSRVLMCLDFATGKLLWEKVVVESPLEKKHQLNSWASGTPVTDGEKVYVSFLDQKDLLVAAYDFNGQEQWQVRPGVFKSVHGFCSCPVIFEDKLIVNGDHDGESYIGALKRSNGETVWKTPREYKTRSYCTPIIREIDGRTQMMLSGSKCVASYDPRTGRQLWMLDGPTEQFVASLVYNKGLIFMTGGFPDHHVMAIDPRGSGKITEASHVKWHYKKADAYVPSPIACGDYFLIVSDGGIGTCYEAVSGDIQWQERLGTHYSASLVTANGLVYFLDDHGQMKVIKPGPTLEVVAVNKLGEDTFASPAISQGRMLIRGTNSLYCIE